MKVTDSQLRWMRAINDFYQKDGWYPGADDLMDALGVNGTNSVSDMVKRLAKKGWVEWPLAVKRTRNHAGPRSARRANSIRLTPRGIEILKENS